jgi:hypothetical protein
MPKQHQGNFRNASTAMTPALQQRQGQAMLSALRWQQCPSGIGNGDSLMTKMTPVPRWQQWQWHQGNVRDDSATPASLPAGCWQ